MDIRDYLKRINYQGSLEPTLQTLQALHKAHLLTVPFENLSIHYKQPISLQEDALFEKIVRCHRGGFCYELNGLFAWLLRQLGFQVTLLSAGVAHATGEFGPEFDHLTLLVHHLSGTNWLADVGFGNSFRVPLRFEVDLEQVEMDGQTYCLRRQVAEDSAGDKQTSWILQHFSTPCWEPQYCFTLQPRTLDDFIEMCHYQQTSPESYFTKKRICSLATPEGRISLSDLSLIITTGGERKEREISSQEEYTAVLADQFGINYDPSWVYFE